MRISYEKGMEKLALPLEEYGHELFPSEEMQECDAILCSSLASRVKAGDRGAVYIFAQGKTTEQLNDIINNRMYGQLFE